VRKLGLIIIVALLWSITLGSETARGRQPIRVYVFAGQSNMVGAATMAGELAAVAPQLEVPSPRVLFWGPTTDLRRRWAPLQPPNEVLQNMFRAGFGPELSAGRELAALHPGSHIAILKYARNATSLHRDWDPRRDGGIYRAMVANARAAIERLEATYETDARIAGFFWMQGESDSKKAINAKAYGANLAYFLKAVRRDFGSRLPVVIGRVADLTKYRPFFRNSHIVRAAQHEVAGADPHTWLVSTDGLEHSTLSPIHYSTRGTVDLGERFVEKRFGL
jgi:hypothetical protein